MLLALPLISSAFPSRLFPAPPFAAFQSLFVAPLQLAEPLGVAFLLQREVAPPLADAVRDVFFPAVAAVATAVAAVATAVAAIVVAAIVVAVAIAAAAIAAVAIAAVAFSAAAVVAAVLIAFVAAVAAVDFLVENLCVAAAFVAYLEKLVSNLEKVQPIVQTGHYSFLDAQVNLA